MTITISDFPDEIRSSVEPLLNAVGLLDQSGGLDLNNWSLDKALAIFSTFDRTDQLITFIESMFGSNIKTMYRDTASGLLSLGPASGHRMERWFEIAGDTNWSAHISVFHEDGTTNNLELGIGVIVQGLQMGSGPVLDLLLGIPLIGIKGTPPVGTGNGSVDSSFILLESSAPTARIALSGEIRPDNAGGRFTAIGMSAESAGIRTAIGIDNGALELELLIKDLAMNATGPGSDLSIDLVNLVGGGSSGSILETLLSILPEGSPLVDDILPMLGIIDSDWHSSSEPNPQWPTIDILDLISNISDMNHVKTMLGVWLTGISQNDVAIQWLHHLFRLIRGSSATSSDISGTLTKSDPLSLKLITLNANASSAIELHVMIAKWVAPDGSQMLDVGFKGKFAKEFGSEIEVEGGLTAWVVSIPLSGSASLDILPSFDLDMIVSGHNNSTLVTAVLDDDGGPLSNLNLSIERAKLGLKLNRNGAITPLIELHDVVIGAHQYAVIDLSSGSAILSALESTLDPIRDAVSDALADGGVLQWIGSLFGLVSPKNYPLRRIDAAFIEGETYEVGDMVCHSEGPQQTDRAYLVIIGGDAPTGEGGPILETDSFMIGTTGPTFKYLGVNGGTWETGDSNDKRIAYIDLLRDPLDALRDYHRKLLDDTTFSHGGSTHCAWGFVFEAFSNLINTALAPMVDIPEPKMTDELIVEGVGTDDNPWKCYVGGDLELPSFRLTASSEDTAGGEKELTIGLGVDLSLLLLAPDVHLSTSIEVDAIEITLPSLSSTDPVTCSLMTGIEIRAKVHDALLNGPERDGLPTPMPLAIHQGSGLMLSLYGVTLGLAWKAGMGFGWRATIHNPRIGSVAPDFRKLLEEELENDPIQMAGFRWTGSKVKGPYRHSVSPALSDFNDAMGEPLPSPITINEAGDTYDIHWHFLGFDAPEVTYDSWEGLSGLIGEDPEDLITIPQGGSALHEEGVRMLIGNIMAGYGGAIGFFTTCFFQINPHLMHLDLAEHVRSNGLSLDITSYTPPSLPRSWKAIHPTSDGRFGLGPLSIPYDWPEIGNGDNSGWVDFVNNPFESIQRFIIKVFSGISAGGEPFALAGMRWIQGLLNGVIPDLSKSDLSWPRNGSTVTIPPFPTEVSGAGTHKNPWSISMPVHEIGKNLEFLVWLDPDGPEDARPMQYALASESDELTRLLEEDSLNPMNLDTSLLQNNWAVEVATILQKIAQYDGRVKQALGGASIDRIATDLANFDGFLKSGDGVSNTNSQLGLMNDGISTNQELGGMASHSELVNNQKIISEVSNFIGAYSPDGWDVAEGFINEFIEDPGGNGMQANPTTEKCQVILLSHLSEQDRWTKLIETIQDSAYLGNPLTPAELFDWNDSSAANIASISNSPMNGLGNGPIQIVKLSKRSFPNSGESVSQVMESEINRTLDIIIQRTDFKYLIVAESFAGSIIADRIMHLEGNGATLDDKILGLMTIGSPHEQLSTADYIPDSIRRAAHMIRALVKTTAIDSEQSDEMMTINRLRTLVHTIDDVLDIDERWYHD
jgi:hypothetical protein